MSERDADGYWTGKGGHLWRTDRGPESHCARPGCGLPYARWSGDRCPAAPDCPATLSDATWIRCGEEEGHEGDHSAVVEWS